ncbi:histone deacetylase complex subunit SAP130-like isoform X2 [Dendronephthya gigantea]|uniref:histone deacetylase complex subunit SAP130-like isoform X2 n=1 Tax=Dendronephthya gigantea TaxID=151771 RepID=UPI00106D9394|nr:histone deacetylase complex subunit SAP130-like isoform X2 [Dendronephthya gigantea]
MSYQPDDRHERDVLPPRITTSNVTLDKEKYDKNSIRSPQPTEVLTMYEVQNLKKSSQSRHIAPASIHSINQTSHFLPQTFGMYPQMSPVMMQTHGTVPAFLPFPRHMPALAVSATAAGVPARPSHATPGRPVVAHHLPPAGLPAQLHAITGMPLPVHPATTTLQQTRSPSPKLLQETASEVPKGDIKSQATPTEAHSVMESRPTVSEPATHSLHHTTSTTTTSKMSLTTGLGKNSLGLSSQPYIKHTTSSPLHLSSAPRTIPGPSPVGPVSSVTSNFNMPNVISHVGSLYSQPSPVSFPTRPQQLQDPTRLLKPNSTASSISFGGTLPTTVISAPAVASIPNSRLDGNRPFPHSVSFPRMPTYFDGHTVSSLQPPLKSYAPIESVVRKPTTISQVPSASHVTTGINSVQLMTSHNPTPSVAVVNMGVPFTNAEASNENTAIHNNSSHPNSSVHSNFSVQNMLSSTPSAPSVPLSSSVTSLSPRPSILRKRQEVSRKTVSQPSLGDPMVPANDISGSPRPDGTLSASHSRQNSPKSETFAQSLEQSQKTLENGPSHPSILSPSKVKREFVSPSSTPPMQTPAVNTVSLSAVPSHDAGASPRKKPRKQNVIATEDKFSSTPVQVQEGNEKKTAVNDKPDPEDDEELKFLMLKRRCVSIYGGYKVNHKAAHNHFQRYSDVKAKDEKKPSLQEIASERGINQRATGWKIHHVAAQLDELKTCEEEVLRKMHDFRERLPKYKSDHKRYTDMVSLHELLQGNIQRSQLVIEQLGETKKTTILEHKQGIMDILKKNIKRHVKKKS